MSEPENGEKTGGSDQRERRGEAPQRPGALPPAEESLIAARRVKAERVRARGENPFANDVTAGEPFDLRGRVARVHEFDNPTNQVPGMGLEFIDVTDELKDRIERFVAQLRRELPESGRTPSPTSSAPKV